MSNLGSLLDVPNNTAQCKETTLPFGGMSNLGTGSLLDVLAPSIQEDATIQASALSVDTALFPLIESIPKMLLWARLYGKYAELAPSMTRIANAVGGLNELSDQELELLAWQLHVDFWEAGWSREKKIQLVRGSTAWHRIKGTPKAVEQALALYDVTATTDASGRGKNWAVYELHLRAIPQGKTLATIARVANIAAPQRCTLRRVYGGDNRRPLILDEAPTLDYGFLDDDSGVWDEETGIKLSFSSRFSSTLRLQHPIRVHALSTTTSACRITYIDTFVLDASQLDTPTIQNSSFASNSVTFAHNETVTAQKHEWEGEWDSRHWNENSSNQAPRPLPRRNFYTYTRVYASQFALDEACLDDSLKRPDHELYTAVEAVQQLDNALLDEHSKSLCVHEVNVEQRFIKYHAVTTQPAQRKAHLQKTSIYGDCIKNRPCTVHYKATMWRNIAHKEVLVLPPYLLPDGTEWTGSWNKRGWNWHGRSEGIHIHHTRETGEEHE